MSETITQAPTPPAITHDPATTPGARGKAGQRGSLDIRDRVVERVAEQAALETAGVVRRTATLGRVTGRSLPRAEVTLAGHRVRLRVAVAVAWPAPLAATSAAVREQVALRVQELTGLTVDAVDVVATVVATVVAPAGRPAADPEGARSTELPRAAHSPLAFPAVARWAGLVAALAVAAGVVLVREVLLLTGVLTGTQWVSPLVADLAQLPGRDAALPAAVAAVVVGLLLLLAAVRPRRSTHLAVGAGGLVWLRRRDLPRLAVAHAERVDGVVRAAATAGRRSVTVQVRSTAAGDAVVAPEVKSVVQQSFSGLSPAPSVAVRVRRLEEESR